MRPEVVIKLSVERWDELFFFLLFLFLFLLLLLGYGVSLLIQNHLRWRLDYLLLLWLGRWRQGVVFRVFLWSLHCPVFIEDFKKSGLIPVKLNDVLSLVSQGVSWEVEMAQNLELLLIFAVIFLFLFSIALIWVLSLPFSPSLLLLIQNLLFLLQL